MAVEMSGIVALHFAVDATVAYTKDALNDIVVAGLDALTSYNAIQDGEIRGIDVTFETAAAESAEVAVTIGGTEGNAKVTMGTDTEKAERFDKGTMSVSKDDKIGVSVKDTSATPTAIDNISIVVYLQLGKTEI
jgi:hypothetical protein